MVKSLARDNWAGCGLTVIESASPLEMKKGHQSFISKADAELVVDKSANSSIMTNNKEGDDNDTNTNLLRKTGDLHPGTVGRAGDDVSQREQTVQENERQGQEGTGSSQGGGSATLGKELNLAGLPGLRGMAESNPGGNSGSEQRLTEPPRTVPPAKDIKLDEHSDIGYNTGAAARYDANLAAIKTLKTIEDEHRQATQKSSLSYLNTPALATAAWAALSLPMRMTPAVSPTPLGPAPRRTKGPDYQRRV